MFLLLHYFSLHKLTTVHRQRFFSRKSLNLTFIKKTQSLQADCIYYLCEALLPELDNIQHEVAAEPLLVKVHLPSESFHLHLHRIKLKTAQLQKIWGAIWCLISSSTYSKISQSDSVSLCVCGSEAQAIFAHFVDFPSIFSSTGVQECCQTVTSVSSGKKSEV
jgi:hypothetical protein